MIGMFNDTSAFAFGKRCASKGLEGAVLRVVVLCKYRVGLAFFFFFLFPFSLSQVQG